MSRFPFLRVTSLVQDIMFKNLRLDDLIILSSLSIRASDTVKSANIKLESFDWELKKNYRKIRIRSGFEQVTFEFESTTAYGNRKMNIGRVEFKRNNRADGCFDGPPRWKTGYRNDFTIREVADFLWNLFKFKTCSMVNNRNFPTRWKMWDKEYSKNLKTLSIGENGPSPVYSPEDVRLILEDVRVSEDVHLNINVEKPFRYSEGLKHKYVTMRNPKWLHFDAILNSESAFIELINYVPRASELNSLLKKWMEGGLENLTVLRISGNILFGYPELRFDLMVFKDLTVQREQRPVTFKFRGEEYALEDRFSREIRRADGKMATVALNYYGFNMYVWHDEQLNAEANE